MATLLESLGKVKIGVWQFWRMVANRNRDYPFHDYVKVALLYEAEDGQAV